jgi:type II secretory pathway component GspD/PulD (secretin)
MKTSRTLVALLLLGVSDFTATWTANAQTAFPPVPAPTAPQTFPPAADPVPLRDIPAAPAVVLPPQGAPAPAASEERVTLNFRNVPIEEVFTFLSRKDKVNIIVSKGVTGMVSVALYGVTLKEAINSVANSAGYWVDMRNGDYVILSRDAAFELPGASMQIKTLKVQYSDTKQVADLLAKYLSRYGKITPLLGRKLIVIEDLPDVVARIERLLDEIDMQPRQIMIEARILEITLDESERFGIDWKRIFGATVGSSSGAGSIGTSGLANGTAAAPGRGFFFSFLDDRLSLFFSALATAGRVRTLSTPKLLALENQEAKVIIGDSTGYRTTTTINLITTESVQFLESGVILKVIPSVDQRGRVMLKIQPEVSSASLLDGVPSKKSVQVTTELICDDGQSIFIGGLIKAKSSTAKDGIPILSDLPILGRLFSSTQDTIATAETVVVITPYIVTQPAELRTVTIEKVEQTERAAGAILDQQLRLERGRPIR